MGIYNTILTLENTQFWFWKLKLILHAHLTSFQECVYHPKCYTGVPLKLHSVPPDLYWVPLTIHRVPLKLHSVPPNLHWVPLNIHREPLKLHSVPPQLIPGASHHS